jgi:hypothetical protein
MSIDLEKHFRELENAVANIEVDRLSLDEKQTVEWPGIHTEIVAIVHATETYKNLKMRLTTVHKQLTDGFPSKVWKGHERDFGKLNFDKLNGYFNMKFESVRNKIQECIDGCEQEIQSRKVMTRIKKFFGRQSHVNVLLTHLKECGEK